MERSSIRDGSQNWKTLERDITSLIFNVFGKLFCKRRKGILIMFIVLEGPDGSGKTTQAVKLVERLRSVNLDVLYLTFPSSSPAGYAARRAIKAHWQEVSDDPLFQAIVVQSLMTADRYSAVDQIRAALRSGTTVIADRWWPSGSVYGTAEGLDPAWLRAMDRLLPDADLNILLDLTVANVAERINARTLGRDKYENPVFQSRVCAGYRRMWMDATGNAKAPGKWIVVDAAKSRDEVHEAIWNSIIIHPPPMIFVRDP